MIGMSIFENLVSISIFGFFFFATLPLCNNCMDYLCRTNIPDALQGRAWGFIGFLSQLGYVLAYAVSGLAADGYWESERNGCRTGSSNDDWYFGCLSFSCGSYISSFSVYQRTGKENGVEES